MKSRVVLTVALLTGMLFGCGLWATPATVAFISDFGLKDDSVAVCKAVMWEVNPKLRVVDITHDIPPYDIKTAGRILEHAARHFPAHTVFVAVIDPGVGSHRKPIVVKTKANHLYVGPDNGILTHVISAEGLVEAREITNPKLIRQGDLSSTFHGRDIFSSVAAHLAAGVSFEHVGPRLETLVSLPLALPTFREGEIVGEVDYIEEPYGNIVTNIPAAMIEEARVKVGQELLVTIANKTFSFPFQRTFSDVAVEKPVALISSREVFYLALNQADFARRYGIQPGVIVKIRFLTP